MIAVALVALIGAGVAVVGALLVAVASGAIPFLEQSAMSPVVALFGALAIALGLLTFAAAAGLWWRRAWGWMGSLVVGIGAVAGAIIALDASGPHAPTVIGLAIALAAVVLVLAPSTRRATGLDRAA
jgi:hypothetical protein